MTIGNSRDEGLRRSLAGWLLLALVGGAVFAAQTLAGNVSARSKVVEAEQFVLKSRDGKNRANMAVNEDGGTYFRLLDASGTPRAEMSLGADGTALFILAGEDRKARLLSRVEKDGKAGHFAYDVNGKTVWSAP